MKKIYLSFLTIATAVSMNAQLNQSNHAPANGDSYNTTVANGAASPSAPGANQTWNYASITITATPITWNATTHSGGTYPQANVKLSSTAGDDIYFESTAASLRYYGGDIVLGGVPATLTYTSPAVFAAYPMNLNTSTMSIVGGTLNAFAPGTFTGTCNVIADATGTLTLPGKTFNNIIRVTTMQDIRLEVPGLGISNGTLTQVNYEYYQTGSKQPMFTISTTTVDAPPTVSPANNNTVLTVFSDYLTVGVNETSLTSNNVVVYPNPASTTVNFASLNNEAISVKLFSLTGALVKEASGTGNLSIDLNDLENGLYIYSLTSGQETISSKIAITH